MANRKITPEDYNWIASEVIKCMDQVREQVGKIWTQYVDETTVVSYIITCENAWLVDDTFLVLYELGAPWFSRTENIHLYEKLVLRLKPGSDFSQVAQFLAERKEAEGACLTAVGTALARSDEALAFKYEHHGFKREAILLVRE